MKSPGQFAANDRPQGRLVYLRTLLCVLLVFFGSTVQAAHAHGRLLPIGKAQISSHTAGQTFLGEELCPLCAAMHSALPSPAVPVLRVAVSQATVVPVLPQSSHRQQWSFELFSRPPPSFA